MKKNKQAGSRILQNREKKTEFQTLRNIQISRVFKKTNFDRNRLYSLMTLVMSFVTVEKKPKQMKTKHEMKTSTKKIEREGKLGRKKIN